MHPLFYFGVLAILFTLLGGLVPLVRKWHDGHLHHFVSFSAGVMMATAFLHLLPDAMEQKTDPTLLGAGVLSSFLFLFILEKFIMLHPCEESHCDFHTMGITAYIGMFIHTFFDGVALGSALMVEGLGLVVFIAIIAHKIPSSFALSSILKVAKWKNSKIIIFLIFFGSSIPLGALASFSVLKYLDPKYIGVALSLSLGSFIYIATSDFLPEVHRNHARRLKNLVAFLIGIVVMGATVFVEIH